MSAREQFLWKVDESVINFNISWRTGKTLDRRQTIFFNDGRSTWNWRENQWRRRQRNTWEGGRSGFSWHALSSLRSSIFRVKGRVVWTLRSPSSSLALSPDERPKPDEIFKYQFLSKSLSVHPLDALLLHVTFYLKVLEIQSGWSSSVSLKQ